MNQDNSYYVMDMMNNQYMPMTYVPNMQPMENSMNPIEVENLYPERYKLIYPMVCKICSENASQPITEELILRMTSEIYFAIESDETVVNINVKTSNRNGDVRNPNEKKIENRITEDRQRRPRNPILNDLIRILILRELLGIPARPPIRPPRPPMPGHGPGPRPPRPPMPGHRPPIMPRD